MTTTNAGNSLKCKTLLFTPQTTNNLTQAKIAAISLKEFFTFSCAQVSVRKQENEKFA
jgi:hypothetical protein